MMRFLIWLLPISLTYGFCLKVYEYGVNSSAQTAIADKHNALRQKLAQGIVPRQPRACNILKIKYDGVLEKEAQKITNTCIYQHVLVHDSRWWWVGQNLFIMKSTGFTKDANWDRVIQSWFNEFSSYSYPDRPNLKTGHYTQVAWASTQYVGCGYTSYLGIGLFKYVKLYACNYGPGGNIMGVAPYKTVADDGRCECTNLC